MPLQKQPININFSQGVDKKTDPFQIPIGKFSELKNSTFSTGGLLSKRNGFGELASISNGSQSFATTFNSDLTAIGNNLNAYSSSLSRFISKGSVQPIGVSVSPVIRNNVNQNQCDSALAPNGLLCTAYTEQSGVTKTYRYVIADSVTGQNIIAPTTITSADSSLGTPRVFLLGVYFIVVFTNKVSSTYHLKYIAVSSVAPSPVTASTDISTSYTPSSNVAFDGAVANNVLYLAWNGASTSGIKMATLSSNLALSSAKNPDPSHTATVVSVCADTTTFGSPTIAVAYYDGSANTYLLSVDQNLNAVIAPVLILGSTAIVNLTLVSASNVISVFGEVIGAYAYDSAIPTNHVFLSTNNATSGANIATTTIIRGVGLASKAFIYSGTPYILTAYQSPYQPTYFLNSSSGSIIAKIAYQNGGGYLPFGLPSVSVNGSVALVPYLFKDQIQSVNKNTNVPSGSQTAGIYSQTGINAANFNFSSQIISSEIGSNLNLTGGYMSAYDGYSITEQGFHLYPDSVEVTTAASAVTPTGTVTTGSNVVTAVSSITGVGLGALITGTGIPVNQVVTAFTSNTITFGPLVSTGSHSAETITVTGIVNVAQAYYYQFTYEWTDNQGNAFRSAPSIPITVTTTGTTSTNTLTVPTLRLTEKISNPVKIVGYRWSAAQEIYYQFTSIASPVLNDPTVDAVTIVDCVSDATILGNNILYTTGGVVENTGAPAASSVFTFDSRLFYISAEDPNLLGYSKQVIESTPVELSDLFTIFVPPDLGAQGPTGPLRCGSQMDDKAILFKASAINYFNGTGPDNTGANSQYSEPVFITSTVGCSNQKSIIFQPGGLMFEFQSEAGNQIWLLGRNLSTEYIGAPVQAYTQNATVQSAVNIPGTNEVRFTMSSGITLVYDYYYGQWDTFVNIPAVSSTLYQGLHTYISSLGGVFQETPGKYLDGSNPVLMGFTTGWINLAGLQSYQRAYYFYLLGTYLSPHKLSIQIAYDYNSSPTQQIVIQPNNFSPVYGQDLTYGSGTPYGGPSNLEKWKIFFTQQRCEAFQLTVQEIYDPSYGVAAGPGLTLSGINCVVGLKKGWRPGTASTNAG